MENYRKTSHAIYDIKYHIEWITKYRQEKRIDLREYRRRGKKRGLRVIKRQSSMQCAEKRWGISRAYI